jgi:hypothetical protein
MTNPQGSTKLEYQRKQATNFRDLIIRHCFELRHSDFGILIVARVTAMQTKDVETKIAMQGK